MRVPLVVLLVFVVVLGLFMWGLHRVTLASYEEVERSQIVHDTNTARIAFMSSQQRLEATAADWARWTDTHEYMLGANPGYPDENLDSATIQSLKLDFLVLCTPEGTVKLMHQVEPSSGALLINPHTLVASIEASAESLRPSTPESVLTGIAEVAGQPFMFASCDITDNSRTAPSSGFLVVGTLVGPSDLGRVRDITGLNVEVVNSASYSPSKDSRTMEGVTITYPDRHDIQGSVVVPTVEGAPALRLVVTSERSGTERALDTLWVVGWGLLATVILFGVAVGVALDRTILRRLVRLHEFIGERPTGGGTARGLVGGDDEITDLAQALDHAEERAHATEEQLRHEVDHDHLTGLVNRRRLEHDMARSLAEAARTGSELSLLLIDVDDFKQVNDVSGHACGDEVLRWFAGELKTAVREYSTVARIGGDEFAVLLPHTGRADAERVLARLTAELESDSYECGGRNHTLSASIGLATYPADALDMDGITSAADADMYENKRMRSKD